MHTTTSKQLSGFILVVLSAALYGTLPILGKMLYATGLTPAATLILRYIFSLLILVIYLLIVKRERVFCLNPLVIMQSLFMILSGVLYFYTFKYLPAGLASVLFFTYPLLVTLLAALIYREKMGGLQYLGLILALVGIVLIGGLAGISAVHLDPRGLLCASLGSVCYALYSLLGQKTSDGNSVLSITATVALLAVVLLPAIFPHELLSLASLQPQQILLGLTMAFFNTVLATSFFLGGVKHIGASRASLVSTAEPAFTLLFAFLLLGETLTPLQFTGSLLVLTSITLALTRTRK